MNTIYLVRHGENPANLTNQFSHRHVDYSLTPKGVLQAQQTADYFKGKRIDAIYCSPLKRAVETARIIGEAIGLEPELVEHFREVNVGALEHDPSDENWELHDSIVEAWMRGQHDTIFPDGEDYHTLLARMRQGVEHALLGRDNQHVIIVGHGGIFTFTLKDICEQIDLMMLLHQPSRNCSITEIEIAPADPGWVGRLKAWSAHAHLSGEAIATLIGHPALDRRPEPSEA